MGGLSSALQFLPVIKEGVGIVSNVLGGEASHREQRQDQDAALRQLQQMQALQQKQMEADNALQREKIALDAQTAEDTRRDALRRAVARQKAMFGSSGVGSSGGSAQAVLLGLFDETEQDLAAREQLDNLRNRAIDLSAENQSSLNVLQRTQLQERQKISSLSSDIGRYSNLASSGIDFLNWGNRIFR